MLRCLTEDQKTKKMDTQKTQIADKLKQATNILVTVSSNPSVDQLAAAIGLTLLLNKLGKHATAVFSGGVPSTIEFLQPEKTLEKNTDSLRDFIIALDKSKADKLRYKVEDQMVKIFITPYRTSISDKDLEFSQGDFNVEVVVALGVNEQQDLDQAITSHGRILHDATVVGVGTQEGVSLGSINWVQKDASSLCEMLLDLGLSLKADVLDGQMATAFLTGIVAETARFSNEKTSSGTMQLSAKLMAAGANQQLVASQLQPAAPEELVVKEVPAEESKEVPEEDAELPEVVEEEQPQPPDETTATKTADGSLLIDHGGPKPVDFSIDGNSETEEKPIEQIHIDNDGILKTEDELDAMKQKKVEPLPPEAVAPVPAEAALPESPAEPPAESSADSRLIMQPPSLGGTLTASGAPDGLDPSTDPLGANVPQSPLLSHDKPAAENPLNAPLPETLQPTAEDIIGATPTLAPMPVQDVSTPDSVVPAATAPEPESASPDTLSDLEKATESPHLDQTLEVPTPKLGPVTTDDVNAARDAVMQAVTSTAPHVLEPVQSLNAQPMDLNLGDMPAVATSPASAFANSSTMVNPGLATPVALPDPTVALDTVLPPSLVPPDPGLPADSTAAPASDASAPPPVPPPLIPPVMPPPEDPNSPGNAAL